MRTLYGDQLSSIDEGLLELTRLVQQSVNRATHALLTADPDIAEQVLLGDSCIDVLREKIEDQVIEVLALQQPVAGDLRMLVAAVRMVADLERMGDLAVHVAKVAKLRLPEVAVPGELLPIIGRMAELASQMVGQLTTIVGDRDLDAVRELEQADEEMDDLRRRSFGIMLDDEWRHGVEPAIDIALVGRYYERIADHAVTLARRVVYLVTGEVRHSR